MSRSNCKLGIIDPKSESEIRFQREKANFEARGINFVEQSFKFLYEFKENREGKVYSMYSNSRHGCIVYSNGQVEYKEIVTSDIAIAKFSGNL